MDHRRCQSSIRPNVHHQQCSSSDVSLSLHRMCASAPRPTDATGARSIRAGTTSIVEGNMTVALSKSIVDALSQGNFTDCTLDANE